MNLIVPMAGTSTRYPGTKPKWMLTHPNGGFMAIEALKGLNLDIFEKIFFVTLREYEATYSFLKGFQEDLESNYIIKRSRVVFLSSRTKDQPTTVHQAIIKERIKGPIFVKDSDNYFSVNVKPKNCVCYYDLNKAGLIIPKNKSYLTFDSRMLINNIIEKNVISPFFSVGGYGFSLAKDFTKYYEQFDKRDTLYISHIIYKMLLQKEKFYGMHVDQYEDWGTIKDWNRFKRKYGALFVDLDGVLVQNSSSHFPPYIGKGKRIEKNIAILRKLSDTGRFQIIITTSREEKYKHKTENELQEMGIHYNRLIMGLYHAQRIVINDYSPTNPYKSCDAINIKRDEEDLAEMFKEIFDFLDE